MRACVKNAFFLFFFHLAIILTGRTIESKLSLSNTPCKWTQFKIQITIHQCKTSVWKYKVQNIIETRARITTAMLSTLDRNINWSFESLYWNELVKSFSDCCIYSSIIAHRSWRQLVFTWWIFTLIWDCEHVWSPVKQRFKSEI